MRIENVFVWGVDMNKHRIMHIDAIAVDEWWDQVYSLCPLGATLIDVNIRTHRYIRGEISVRTYATQDRVNQQRIDATWNEMLRIHALNGNIGVVMILMESGNTIMTGWDYNSDSPQPSRHAAENWTQFLPRRD